MKTRQEYLKTIDKELLCRSRRRWNYFVPGANDCEGSDSGKFLCRINIFKHYSPVNCFWGNEEQKYDDAMWAVRLKRKVNERYVDSTPIKALWIMIGSDHEFTSFDEFYMSIREYWKKGAKIGPKDGRKKIGPDNFTLYIP